MFYLYTTLWPKRLSRSRVYPGTGFSATSLQPSNAGYPGRENGHQLVCYDLNDLKGHLPCKVFIELQKTTTWKKLMQQWRSQSEEDPMDISAFKALLKD